MPQSTQVPSRAAAPGARPGAARPVPAPRPVTTRPAPAPGSAARRSHAPLLILLALLSAVSLAGAPYYLLSQGQRVRSPLHVWLKPTGYVGQAAGIGALTLFLFMWLYPMRKKFRALAFTGSIARWLDVHIAAGLCLPLLAAVHAGWHFSGLIGLGFWAMMVVVVSGVVGRYLYSRIPRSRSGLEMTLEEIDTERKVLLKYVAQTTGLDPFEVERLLAPRPAAAGAGLFASLGGFVADDLHRWRAGRQLSRGWRSARPAAPVDRRVVRLVSRMARRQMALGQQVRFLDATQRVFRYWHVAHRPVAISALLAVVIHVGVAVAMGVTWFR